MNQGSSGSIAIDANAKIQIMMLVEQKMRVLLQEGKQYMFHCRRDKLTVSDLERAMRNYNMDKLLGHNNGSIERIVSTKGKEQKIRIEDPIIAVSDVLSSEIRELPIETTFSVNWLVVNGKQVNFLSTYDENNKDDQEEEVPIQLRSQAIHTMSFECELYLQNIKSRMYSDEYCMRYEVYHQLQIDEGLKQICPYLVNWIQSEVQKNMRLKPERMLQNLDYLMHVTHGLILNPHLEISLYLHLLLPCILSCAVGKSLSASSAENHWELRSFSAVVLNEVYKKYGTEYPKLLKQILATLNKVLHNPRSTLPSIFGVIECVSRMGNSVIELLLLPFYKELFFNLSNLLKKEQSSVAQLQIRRCLYALIESVTEVWKSAEKRREVNYATESLCEEVDKVMKALPGTSEMVFTEAALPLCYRHEEGVWDICDYVI